MNSGRIVERRDHVRNTFFSFFSFIAETFFIRWSSTNGPLCNERPMFPYRFLALRVTIHLFVRLLLRVLKPRVGWPQGVPGARPPEVLPSPPPCGWSTGFIETPRLCGRLPSQRVRPALPIVTFSWSIFPTWPMVAIQCCETFRVSPEGSLTSAYSPSLATSCACPPAERTIWAPLPGRNSRLWIVVPGGMFLSGSALP